jgi:hypothetical protein
MPVCLVQQVADGPLYPDPSVTDLATCSYVAESGVEYSQGWNALGSLSIEDASVIAPYIGVVWAVAWTFRAIAKTLNINESSSHE